MTFISKLVVLDVSKTADVLQESSNSILYFQVEFLLLFLALPFACEKDCWKSKPLFKCAGFHLEYCPRGANISNLDTKELKIVR